MTKFWKIVLGIAVIVLSIVHYGLKYSSKSKNLLLEQHTDSIPAFVGLNMQAVRFNEQGEKQYIAEVKKVEYFNDGKQTHFTTPKLWFFDKKDPNSSADEQNLNKIWKASADEALLDKDQLLSLKNNVLVENLTPNALVQGLKNRAVQIDINTGDISSPYQTEIYGKGLKSIGNRLSGNLKSQKVNLEDQVETNYVF